MKKNKIMDIACMCVETVSGLVLKIVLISLCETIEQ
jgi:hypothetical protein